jgi:hypothetical protein
MFRESSAIDSERTAASVRSLYTKYADNENWFDGTPDSVDRRIAQIKKISNLCKAATVRLAGRNAGSQYIALAAEMDSDRTALEGLRRDLLTAAADHDDLDPSTHDDKYNKTAADVPAGPVGGEGPPMDYDTDSGTTAIADHGNSSHSIASRRAEARYFIAEQQCDDVRELLIRAKNQAERIASTLPVRQARAQVAFFVEAVRREAERSYNPKQYAEYAHRNGLNPGDKLTADRYAREHGVPMEVAQGYADKHPVRGAARTASAKDFPAELMYMEW